MIKNAISGVYILHPRPGPKHGDKSKPRPIQKLLRYLRQLYAYIIVDTSSYLNDVTLSVLDVAEAVVLVTVQDIPSIKNDRLFLDLY